MTETLVTIAGQDESVKKKGVSEKVKGICPFCEYKLLDLLGHIRIVHKKVKTTSKVDDSSEGATNSSPQGNFKCKLCSKSFNSVRELVSHRQLHPQFKHHSCPKCNTEFEFFPELKNHRINDCPKRKRKKQTNHPTSLSTAQQGSLAGPLESTATTSLSALGSDNLDSCLTTITTPAVQQHIHQEPFEGRGTVACMLCSKTFTLKVLLKRHYISHHGYKPDQAGKPASTESKDSATHACQFCSDSFASEHDLIRHYLTMHCIISGAICPYCEGCKKFDDVDAHVNKYHTWDKCAPFHDCKVCRLRLCSYEDLRQHRQIHDKKTVEVRVGSTASGESVVVHSRVGALTDIANRGGVRCQLCNTFKLRKDHLYMHYVKHHGYDPRQGIEEEKKQKREDELAKKSTGEGGARAAVGLADQSGGSSLWSCPSCQKPFNSRHHLIRHALKAHSAYSGQICPYCWGRQPERYLDLKAHVKEKHLDQLMAYNANNECKVCGDKFQGYAELRDHVQNHGENFRAPYGHPEGPVRRNRVSKSKKGDLGNAKKGDGGSSSAWTPSLGGAHMQKLLDETFDRNKDDAKLEDVDPDCDLHNVSISSTLFNQIFASSADDQTDGKC